MAQNVKIWKRTSSKIIKKLPESIQHVPHYNKIDFLKDTIGATNVILSYDSQMLCVMFKNKDKNIRIYRTKN